MRIPGSTSTRAARHRSTRRALRERRAASGVDDGSLLLTLGLRRGPQRHSAFVVRSERPTARTTAVSHSQVAEEGACRTLMTEAPARTHPSTARRHFRTVLRLRRHTRCGMGSNRTASRSVRAGWPERRWLSASCRTFLLVRRTRPLRLRGRDGLPGAQVGRRATAGRHVDSQPALAANLRYVALRPRSPRNARRLPIGDLLLRLPRAT